MHATDRSVRRAAGLPRTALALAALLLLCSCSAQQTATTAAPQGTPQASVVPAVFVLASDDKVSITVWRNDDLTTQATVDPAGNIQMPLVGNVRAAGLTPAQLVTNLEAALARFIRNPRVNVAVSDLGSRVVYVLGEVKTPGGIRMSAGMTAIEALAQAGGATNDAKQEKTVLVRVNEKNQAVATILDLEEDAASDSARYALLSRDILYVPATALAKVEDFMMRLDTILQPFLTTAGVIVLGKAAANIVGGTSSSTTTPPVNSSPVTVSP